MIPRKKQLKPSPKKVAAPPRQLEALASTGDFAARVVAIVEEAPLTDKPKKMKQLPLTKRRKR